jgi:hypothetical protein
MNTRTVTKFVHEGQYAAEVKVELLDSDEGWSPYLSLGDAYKLDSVRQALQAGDTHAASRYGKVFLLTPLYPWT